MLSVDVIDTITESNRGKESVCFSLYFLTILEGNWGSSLSRTKSRNYRGILLTGLLSGLLASSYSTVLPVQEMVLPISCALLQQLSIKASLTDMATGQSDLGYFYFLAALGHSSTVA